MDETELNSKIKDLKVDLLKLSLFDYYEDFCKEVDSSKDLCYKVDVVNYYEGLI